jgi:uncharacterized membrane protein YhfC
MDIDIPFFAHLFNGLLMVAIPVGVTIYLVNHWKMSSRIWWIGAATFILSQVVHIPFNWGVNKLLNQASMISWAPVFQLLFTAAFFGLSAGIFEEVARYLVLRLWAKDARSWRNGILFGAGHGGAEAIILGVIVMYAFFQLAALRNADLAGVFPPNQLFLAQKQVTAYWSATWYDSLLGFVERLFTIPDQIAMAVMVMQVFTRKQIRWLFLAIGYHALLDASGIINMEYLGVYWTEAVFCGFAILSIVLIFVLCQPEPLENNLPNLPHPVIGMPKPIEETSENLEKTRYQ